MEAKASSKKRRRFASPYDAAAATVAVGGVVTRSRSSEVFFHHNRSGRARRDPKPYLLQCASTRSPCPKVSIKENFDRGDGNDNIGVTSVKDLRWRRVFSPVLKIHSEKGSVGSNNGEDDAKIGFGFDLGLGQENEKDLGNVEIESAEKDEWIQTTPPDDEIVRKSEQSIGLGVESQSRNDSSGNQDEKKNYFNEKTRSGVLAFKSRMKLFKNPSSFSYKRLLPFLMDLAKDNSNALEIHPCRKVEKAVEEKPVPSLINRPNTNFSPDGHWFGASDAPITQSKETILICSSDADHSNLVFHEQPIIECPAQKTSQQSNVSGNHDPVICTQFNSPDESASQEQPNMPDNPSKLETVEDFNGSVKENDPLVKSACSPLISPEPLSATEDALGGPSNSSEEVEDNGSKLKVSEISPDVKSSGAFCFRRHSAHIEDNVPLENLLCSVTKGILKRNPRGCRGICNCINCASFRLHAERAFEFSRNQLQDAEEVVMGLMRELSGMRSLLENSVNGGEGHAPSDVNEVREACRKASRAEELAKSHIRDMKLELGIHCRTTCLQRPRVKFSDVEPLAPMTLNFESQFK